MEEWITIQLNYLDKAKSFLYLCYDQKKAYIRRPGPRPLYNGLTMTMLLLYRQAHFLQISKDWVEMLLLKEI